MILIPSYYLIKVLPRGNLSLCLSYSSVYGVWESEPSRYLFSPPYPGSGSQGFILNFSSFGSFLLLAKPWNSAVFDLAPALWELWAPNSKFIIRILSSRAIEKLSTQHIHVPFEKIQNQFSVRIFDLPDHLAPHEGMVWKIPGGTFCVYVSSIEWGTFWVFTLRSSRVLAYRVKNRGRKRLSQLFRVGLVLT